MKRPNIVQIKQANRECVGCGWGKATLYVLANSEDEGWELFQQKGGLCAECFLEKVVMEEQV